MSNYQSSPYPTTSPRTKRKKRSTASNNPNDLQPAGDLRITKKMKYRRNPETNIFEYIPSHLPYNTNNNSEPSLVVEKSSNEKKQIIADSFALLPHDYKEKVVKAGISQRLCDRYWNIMLNILHFKTKEEFVTTEQIKSGFEYRRAPMYKPEEQELEEINDKDFELSDYEIIEQIGKGGFGKVFLVKSLFDSSEVAIKKTPHKTAKQIGKNVLEIKYLRLCRSHPNVVNFMRSNQIGEEIWMVTELLKGGSLRDVSRQYALQEKHISYIAKQILKALVFLHSNQLVHRDIKCANVMIGSSGEVKLIDFGFCCSVAKGQVCGMVGSPFWMPPEMIKRQSYGASADIWSFGICLMEMANQQPPNRKSSIKAMFTAATKGYPKPFDDPSKWSDSFKHFMSLCLRVDPSRRSTSSELINHPWIRDHKVPKREMKELFSAIQHSKK